jgi:hypothetical protein
LIAVFGRTSGTPALSSRAAKASGPIFSRVATAGTFSE